jgi:tetratricopeptide (TPR) repeat protein
MARLGVFSVAFLSVCLAGHAEDSRDLSAPTFWPRPLSAPALPLGPRDPASVAAAGEGGAAAAEEGRPREDAAQPESREELAALVVVQLDAIEAEQARNGDRSPELIGQLSSLAATYEKLGDYASADAALQHAIEIARIDFGLHSLDQADVVESLVATRQTRGDYGGAAEKRRYLHELVGRNRDDPRVVGILAEMAGQEMDNARRLVGVPAPAVIAVTSGGGDGLLSMAQPTPSLAALHAAQSDYIAAIQAAVRTRTGNTADVFALQDALSDTVYFGLAHPEILGPGHKRSAWSSNGGAPPWYPTLGFTGAQILRHKALDSMSFRRAPLDVAKDLIALADWYLVFGSFDGASGRKSYGPAWDTYGMARDLLVRSNVATETIDELLSPEVPPSVPVLPESIAGTVHDRVLRGYVDASVEFTRFGDVKRVEILGRSPAVTKDIEEELRRYVAEQTFRPRFVNGEFPRSDRFAARFYFD